MNVELESPPITARAIGACVSPPSPKPSASGNSPSTVVSVVMRIGRKRRVPASRIARSSGSPSRRSRLAVSTSRIALFTTIPASMMQPMKDCMLKVVFVR